LKKIGLDFHGVIDKEPELWSFLTENLIEKGYEIHIITGHENNEKFRAELKSLNIVWTHLFSIISYHKSIGTPVTYDKNGDPWIDEEIWNKSKAEYCKKENIDIIIDDSKIYEKYFNNCSTFYISFEMFKQLMEMIINGKIKG